MRGVWEWLTERGEAVAADGRWQLALVVAAYLAVVYVTNRLLITAPPRLQLLERIAEERTELSLPPDPYRTAHEQEIGTPHLPWRTRRSSTEDAETAQRGGDRLGRDFSPPDADERRRQDIHTRIAALLDQAEDGVSYRLPLGKRGNRERRKRRNHPYITLGKVLAGWRYVHAAERMRVKASPPEERLAHAVVAAQRLREIDSRDATFLAAEITARVQRAERSADGEAASRNGRRRRAPSLVSTVVNGGRNSRTARAAESTEPAPERGLQTQGPRWDDLAVLLGEGLRLAWDHEDLQLQKAAEAQRRAVWLTAVGLLVVLLVGLNLDHREALLLGGVGGFLAPLTAVWQKTDKSKVDEYATSWGLLLLSPVAGALAAFSGVLLVRFLSDPNINVLGEIFRNNSWENPDTPVALTIALLFGFSGRLFSKLALTAVPHVLPPAPGSGVPPTPDEGNHPADEPAPTPPNNGGGGRGTADANRHRTSRSARGG